ncbi:MAG: hypothetical protein QXN93_02545 [Methanomassiliicoccales archaeon]
MNPQKALAAVATVALFLVVVISISSTNWIPGQITHFEMGMIAVTLFEDYGITFLVIGIVMFAAMLGGVFLAKEESK